MFSGQRPRGSRDPRELDPIEDNLTQGVSTQPAHLRFPGQLEASVNWVFNVRDGMSKRPGTHYFARVGSPAMVPGGNYREHEIDRDSTERYIVLFGESTVRIFDTINGDEATVTIDSDSAEYLWANGAEADDLRFLTQDDTTFIVNTKVPASSMRSADYVVTSTARDYDVLRAITPADETYHQTEEDSDEYPAGYYKYDVDGVTFAKVQFPAVSGDGNAWEQGFYNDAVLPVGSPPLGFTIYFQKAPLTFVDGAFTNATKRLVKASAFTSASVGDWIKVTGGTGVTPDWYEIAAKIDDDEVELTADIGGTDPADVAAVSIASRHQPSYSVDSTAQPDMYAVAAKWQTALQATGAVDALVSWTETAYQAGYFTITSPYRGSGATILDIGAPGSGADATAGGYMFTASGATITAGSGTGSLTMDPDSRWTNVPAPNQADAELDPLTMPQVLVRTKKGPAATFAIDPIDWNARTSGDEVSNPSPTPISAAQTGTITNITLASPGVVTCVGHGLVTNDIIYIHSSNSTPVIDGIRTVTRINDDTFSVGVNTTGAGTAGRWSKGAKPIADILFVRGRLSLAIGDRFIASQAGDIYNFYQANVAEIVDSDPIDVPIGSEGVAIITFMVQSQKTTILFTESGVQYELNEAESLTPSTCRFTATTRHKSQSPTFGVRPKNLSSVLYFIGDTDTSAILWEYRRDDLQAISTASDVSKHYEGALPPEIRTFVAAPSANRVYALEENDRNLYVYQAHWEGVQKKQSAWGTFQFDGNYRISDIVVLDDRVWLLVEMAPPATAAVGTGDTVVTLASHGLSNGNTVSIFDSTTTPSIDGTWTVANVTGGTFELSGSTITAGGSCRVCAGQFHLESATVHREAIKPAAGGLSAWPYAIHMDRQIPVTGVYNGGGNYTEFTLPTGLVGPGSTINRIVLGPAFGADAGDVIDTGFTYGSTYIRIPGDYSDGQVVLGRFFSPSAELTRPFLRNQQGQADRLSSFIIGRAIVAYETAGTFSVNVAYDQPGPSTVTTTMTSNDATVESGELIAPVRSKASKCAVTITSPNPLPVTITGIQWVGSYADGVK